MLVHLFIGKLSHRILSCLMVQLLDDGYQRYSILVIYISFKQTELRLFSFFSISFLFKLHFSLPEVVCDTDRGGHMFFKTIRKSQGWWDSPVPVSHLFLALEMK